MASSPATPTQSPGDDLIEIDLKIPWVAGLLAWLIPGAGHLYQGRMLKAAIFGGCILGTFFFGLALGGGHVVYASMAKNDRRWHFVCQAGVGGVVVPAMIQNHRVMNRREPLFGGVLAPPTQPVEENGYDELAEWHRRYHSRFELGTLYTMVAGLLNLLAIYDAMAGPMLARPVEEEPEKKKPE